jgi:hypothetical protein
MKKILIFALLLISFYGVAQQDKEIFVTLTTGTDTTLYLINRHHGLLTVDFTLINCSTSTLDVGLTDDRVSFVSASGATFPITLSKVTYTKTANGYTRNRIAFQSANWPGTYIAVKLTKVDATTGSWKITY